jgi:hypothetical protein
MGVIEPFCCVISPYNNTLHVSQRIISTHWPHSADAFLSPHVVSAVLSVVYRMMREKRSIGETHRDNCIVVSNLQTPRKGGSFIPASRTAERTPPTFTRQGFTLVEFLPRCAGDSGDFGLDSRHIRLALRHIPAHTSPDQPGTPQR